MKIGAASRIIQIVTELESFFSEVSRAIDEALDKLIPSEDTEPIRLHQAIRWSVFGGGKRFRPALLIAVGRTFVSADEDLMTTAAAVEMIHTYSLIHDDLPAMDDDDLRRGRATCHKKFDEATAILAGDALQAMAFGALANDTKLGESTRLRLVAELAIAAGRMVAGQQLDLESEGKPVSASDVERIHKNKTGALISFSAIAGAVIAGAAGSDLDAISRYADRLGLLFQITDDVLDITESTSTLGKTAAKDIDSGKATFPSVYGIDGSRERIKTVHEQALSELKVIGRPTELLVQIADYIVDRRF